MLAVTRAGGLPADLHEREQGRLGDAEAPAPGGGGADARRLLLGLLLVSRGRRLAELAVRQVGSAVGQAVEAVVQVVRQPHHELLQRPRLPLKYGHVQLHRLPAKARAPDHELLLVDRSRLVGVDQVKQLLHLLHVHLQGLQERDNFGRLDLLPQLREADLARAVVVDLIEELLHCVHKLLLTVNLSLHNVLSVILGPLQDTVNEDCAYHVEHGEHRERNERIEE
mmetsp:Transcript_19398/g.51893  ORF Transcript_19398/g.51893 Transcript_19398/m.51893 type:complete len:225 (-) Transcript_19398:582-1256(-)